MMFGEALELLRAGKAVARHQWEAEGSTAFLVLIPSREVTVSCKPMSDFLREGTQMTVDDHIDVIDTDAGLPRCAVGWQPSQTDILANDWVAVEL